MTKWGLAWRRGWNLAITVAAVLMTATGCGATLRIGNRQTTVGLGMSRQQVQQMLGPPQTVMRQQFDDVLIETWKYADRTMTFRNGVLQSWLGVGDATDAPASGVLR